MSLTSYFETIKSLSANFFWTIHPSPPSEKQLQVLESMEPDKLYVENVRHFFGVSKENAEFLCEEATKEGLLKRKIGLLCLNDHNVILAVDHENEIPEEVKCDICEDMQRDRSIFESAELGRIVFYTSPA
jgi:hypothetical protein